MVVSVYEDDVVWFSGFWRDGGKVDAVDLRRGELGAEMVGDSAGATAHIEDTGRALDRGVEDFAEHDLLYEFMLAVESLMFACADVC